MILSTMSPVDEPETIITLPCEFSYQPYVPIERTSTVQTSKGSFTQNSVPRFLHGTQTFTWKIGLTTCATAELLYGLYSSGLLYNFTGAYGEEYLVRPQKPEVKRVGGYWEMSGTFRVICVTVDFDPCFQCDL